MADERGGQREGQRKGMGEIPLASSWMVTFGPLKLRTTSCNVALLGLRDAPLGPGFHLVLFFLVEREERERETEYLQNWDLVWR